VAENDEREQDGESQGDEQQESQSNGGGDGGIVSALLSQLGEHRAVLAPVATTAAAAAATYAVKKLPDLFDSAEGAGMDKVRKTVDKAKDAGGAKGMAAGAASRALSGGGGGGIVERLKEGGKQEATEKAEESGGITGAMAKVAGKLGGKQQGGMGWGRGRRLPILRSIDVAAPVETVYNQYTQFEELNSFMHRTEAVDQEEDEVVTWHENVWGRRRHWKAQITEQIPNERIAWEIKGGGQGVGVITFHELAPRLTRVEVVFDWQPKGFVEKIGSGLRVHKRAAKTDLYRFKAFVETRGEESGGWPGKIEDGEAKGQTRNKRNRKADPIPTEAQAHSESDEKKTREKAAKSESKDDSKSESKDDSKSKSDNGDEQGQNGDEGERDEAREERKRHREERAKQRG
jgi:uncharacterized membrane protein